MTRISLAQLPRAVGEEYSRTETVLAVDGKTIINSYGFPNREKLIVGSLWDEEASKQLVEMTFNEFKESCSELSIQACQPWNDLFLEAAITCRDRKNNVSEKVIALLDPPLTKWSKPWSFSQYYIAFQEHVPKLGQEIFTFFDSRKDYATVNTGGVQIIDFPKDVPIRTILEQLWAFVAEVHEVTERELTANLNKGSLVTFFDFPPAVKVACEQYLQYFIQFLDDLGIEADSQISSEAGKVLFSVTPNSGEEALEAIQAALATYLELPQKPDMGGFDVTADIAVNQLRSQVLHLQGQLMVAQGMLQLGQATIQAKDQTINAQAMQLAMFQSGQLLQPGTQDLRRIAHVQEPHQSKAEPLFGEMVKVSTIKKLGIEIDLAGMLRSLKRKLPGGNG
jgi:hypothetical protein